MEIGYHLQYAFYIFSDYVLPTVNDLILPIFFFILLYFSFVALKTGKIGKIDLNNAFQRRYEIAAYDGSTISVGSEIPLDSEGKVDQKEFAKRTWVLTQQYHAQGLQQSKISFLFSIVSAVLGFSVILYGAFLAVSPAGLSVGGVEVPSNASLTTSIGTQSILAMVSGIAIDAVAALFFVQSNKARLLMSDFFDKLRIDRKLEESLALIREIDDRQIAGRTQALLAINLAEIQLDGPIFDRVLSGEYPAGPVDGTGPKAKANRTNPKTTASDADNSIEIGVKSSKL